MARRRKKKTERIIHLSAGPLPPRLAERFPNCPLIFCDASQLHHGGLAAVLFEHDEADPVIATHTVPVIGSNELELQAAIFALEQAGLNFPELPVALFSDNQDAVTRLNLAKTAGLAQDPELTDTFPALDLAALLANASICWIKGHSACRGNALADRHARVAASQGLFQRTIARGGEA